MNIHEYQAKQLLAKYDVPIPVGDISYKTHDAERVAKWLDVPERAAGISLADPFTEYVMRSSANTIVTRPMARMLASKQRCVSTTPLGLPVLPEVNWSIAGSSASAL